MPGAQGYAVVSCHVERLLDDRVWEAYSAFVRSKPGGFAIASLVRPPAAGEPGAASFVERAAQLADFGAYGHHTHWTSPTHARPTGGDPAAVVRKENAWLREQGLEPRFFCGGGWYTDLDVMSVVGELGYADCTATAWRPSYLPAGSARIGLDAPARVVLPSGARVLELPATHSAGAAARLLARPLPGLVHLYFHDHELRDRRRSRLLAWTMRLLALRRRPADLRELGADREVAWGAVWAA
jgi:hypothetical protein